MGALLQEDNCVNSMSSRKEGTGLLSVGGGVEGRLYDDNSACKMRT